MRWWVVLVLLLVGCGQPSGPESLTTWQGTFTVPGTAFIDGRDQNPNGPTTIMILRIWDAVPHNRPVCTVPHGAGVKLLAIKRSEEEDRYYFQIDSGDCQGWISELYIALQSHPPEGDQLH